MIMEFIALMFSGFYIPFLLLHLPDAMGRGDKFGSTIMISFIVALLLLDLIVFLL